MLDTQPVGRGSFPTTHWSMVIKAANTGDSAAMAQALARLCEAYWHPIYFHIRARGFDADAARDLTQGFFVRVLEKDYFTTVSQEKGRFRSFLQACVNHFLSNERDYASAAKRGAGIAALSLDFESAEKRYSREPVGGVPPDLVFERQWAHDLLERTLERLRRESVHPHFEVLQPFLTGDVHRGAYEEKAAALGITEGALKVAVHRLRKRYGATLRAEIGETVADPAEIKEEIRYLLKVLS